MLVLNDDVWCQYDCSRVMPLYFDRKHHTRALFCLQYSIGRAKCWYLVRWPAKPSYRLLNTNMLTRVHYYHDLRKLNASKPETMTLRNQQMGKTGDVYPQPKQRCHPRVSSDLLILWTQIDNINLRRYASSTPIKTCCKHDNISGKKKLNY